MEKPQKMYCRFCAERKRPDKLFDLEKDLRKWEETTQKLFHLNAAYIDVSSQNALPKTICFVCWDSLNKAYDFLDNLKKAQSVLADLFTGNETFKFGLSGDDSSPAFDDSFSFEHQTINETDEIKKESTSIQIQEENLPSAPFHNDLLAKAVSCIHPVKKEPKEESSDDPKTQYDGTPPENVLNNESYDQSLNVQALLDAAIGDVPYTANLTLYAKELPVLSKKSTKHWKDYPWICAHCNNEFSDMDMLRRHSKEVHKSCAAYTCIDCKESVRCFDFEYFVNHVRKHRKNLRSLCYYCDIKTENLKDHLLTHFQKYQTACTICGEILRNEDSLLKHTKEYSSTKTRKPRRKRGTPITIDDLTCKLCHKVYKNLNSLRDHKKLHTSERKRNYTCDRCGKTFFNKGTLTTHIMSHDKIRPHICRICKKSFLFPNMLRRHVEMHSGVKPFSCEQCGRCFRLQYQLNAHKIVHTDSLPYICQYCSKAFRFKQILKNHERQHTGSKPYSCQLCSMEFTNWSNYNKHMKRRHNIDTSKKKITPDGVFPINPETGQLILDEDPVGTEEWKNKIMIPGKRGKKKKVIKEEDKLVC